MDAKKYEGKTTLTVEEIKKDMKEKVIKVFNVEGKFGDQICLESKDFRMYVNQTSLKNLIASFGVETDGWIGEYVTFEVGKGNKDQDIVVIKKAE